MATQSTITKQRENIRYQEVKLGYRGVRENPTIPLATSIDSIDDLREITTELGSRDYVKAVFAKHPVTGEVKAVVFPGHRELFYPHHSDIYFRILDEWGIAPVNMDEKSAIPYNAPIYNQIVWLKGLGKTAPEDSKPLLASAVGFIANYNPEGKLTFHMGSFITNSQADDETFKIDRSLFEDGIEWMKRMAGNCNCDFQVSEIQKELEDRLV